MQVKGVHSFEVTKDQLWAYLLDPVVLAKITPGVSQLETIEEDNYKSISDIKIGPVKGSFKGKLKVIDKHEPESFAIEMEQLSKIGNAHGTIAMTLSDTDSEHTELSFDGKVRLSGVIARTGQRVLSGVANTITKEVFASLEQHIVEDAATAPPTEIVEESVESTATGSDNTESTGLFSWLRRLFKKIFN